MSGAVRLVVLATLLLSACQGGRDGSVPQRDAITASDTAAQQANLSQYVDPRIGSFPPGFTSPGAVRPHGMVAPGPDTEGPFNYGGYSVNNLLITGFSQTHMSAGVYQGGQIPLMPITGNPGAQDLSDLGYPGSVPAYASPYNKLSEVAEAGYYKVDLLRYGSTAEMTASARTALHRYSWSGHGEPGIVLEPSRDLKGHHSARIEVIDERTILGRVNTSSPEHTVYFALHSDTPFVVHTLDGQVIAPEYGDESDNLTLVLRPARTPVQIKLGLSYVDQAGALNNLQQEIPHWDFEQVRSEAREQWNRELYRIEVGGASDSRLRSFYTALYRTLKFPNLLSDVDGRYRMEDSLRQDPTRPRYTQFSLWDSYRGHSALLAEIIPQRYTDMVMSMVEYAQISGKLPRWQLANRDPGYMSGDPAIAYVGEAWCRGLLDADQRAQAWQAMLDTVSLRDAEIVAGYKPTRQPEHLLEAASGGPREAGTTLEYGLADFALAAMAQDYGDSAVREQRLNQALNYRNLFDPALGWIRPRDEGGDWISPFQPEFGFGFQEGTSWQYSWLAQHDYAWLLDGMRAVEDPATRLDTFFGYPLNQAGLLWPAVQNQITFFGVFYFGNQYAPGNEHDLQAPYVYNYLGQPEKTQIAVRAATQLYTDTALGMPGNDDLGALSGWLVWSMLGLYPINPGLPHFVLGSAEFASARLRRPGGDLLIARGEDGYVQAATLNGAVLVAPSLILPRQGAELLLQTGSDAGTTFQAPPPSISTHPLQAFGCAGG